MKRRCVAATRRIPVAILVGLTSLPVFAFEVVEPGETQAFAAADRCDGTPFEDTIFKGTNSTCVDPARVEAAAILSVAAVNSDVTAFSTVFTDFLVSGTNGSVLDATVSATVNWDGVLFGAGVLGAGAAVKIELLLVDDTDGAIKAHTVVLDKRQDSTGLKGLDVGGTHVSGGNEVSLRGAVVRGHEHSIQLKLTCSAESGLVGLDVGCIFMNDVFGIDLGGDPHAEWTSLSITVEQDIFDRLDRIDAKLLQIERKIDALDGRMDLMNAKLNEIIRLLLLPQGKRTSDFLDCGGEPCDFPLKSEKSRKGKGRR